MKTKNFKKTLNTTKEKIERAGGDKPNYAHAYANAARLAEERLRKLYTCSLDRCVAQLIKDAIVHENYHDEDSPRYKLAVAYCELVVKDLIQGLVNKKTNTRDFHTAELVMMRPRDMMFEYLSICKPALNVKIAAVAKGRYIHRLQLRAKRAAKINSLKTVKQVL